MVLPLLKINTTGVCVSFDDIIFSSTSCIFSESLQQHWEQHTGQSAKKKSQVHITVLDTSLCTIYEILHSMVSLCCGKTFDYMLCKIDVI